MIKVIRGNPTREELAAALLAVRATAAAGVGFEPPPPAPDADWSSPTRLARTHLPQPGPTSWARTYWP